jgi:hypothetical protein
MADATTLTGNGNQPISVAGCKSQICHWPILAQFHKEIEMDAYFEVQDVVVARGDRNTFKRARMLLVHNKIEILSQDQIKGIMLSAEDEGQRDIADAARTVYEFWDVFEE